MAHFFIQSLKHDALDIEIGVETSEGEPRGSLVALFYNQIPLDKKKARYLPSGLFCFLVR